MFGPFLACVKNVQVGLTAGLVSQFFARIECLTRTAFWENIFIAILASLVKKETGTEILYSVKLASLQTSKTLSVPRNLHFSFT
jgi:hypothetical protein